MATYNWQFLSWFCSTLTAELEMGIGAFPFFTKDKGLKYFDNCRTNEIAVVKDKKMVFLAIRKGKHCSQTETIFSFVWGVYW